MTDPRVNETEIATVPPDAGLGRLFAPGLRTKDRLVVLRELSAALWGRGRHQSGFTERAAELLAASVAQLPIREAGALQAQFGLNTEATGRRLVEDAAALAGWVWTAAAVVPAPPPVVHMVKVVLHSAIEIRLIGELYAVYGDPTTPRDPAWLNTVMHAWAVGHPVAAGPSSAVGARDIALKLRASYVNLVSDYSRVARVVHRGRDGGLAVKGLGERFQRRARLDPNSWAPPTDLSTMDLIATTVGSAVRSKLGLPRGEALGEPAASKGPQPYVAEAWSQHHQARSAAAAAVQIPGNAPSLARLASALDTQEQHLRRLTAVLRLSAPPTTPVPAQRHSHEAQDPLAQAHAHTGRADDAIDLAEVAGSRPRRLSGWPIPARNSLIYAIAALILLAPVGWLISTTIGARGFDLGIGVLLALSICGLPFLTYGIGMLAIGPMFRPWLGGQVPRSPIIGLAVTGAVVCLVAFVVSVVALL